MSNNCFEVHFISWISSCCKDYNDDFIKCKSCSIMYLHPRQLDGAGYENYSHYIKYSVNKTYIMRKIGDYTKLISKINYFISINEIENYLLFL